MQTQQDSQCESCWLGIWVSMFVFLETRARLIKRVKLTQFFLIVCGGINTSDSACRVWQGGPCYSVTPTCHTYLALSLRLDISSYHFTLDNVDIIYVGYDPNCPTTGEKAQKYSNFSILSLRIDRWKIKKNEWKIIPNESFKLWLLNVLRPSIQFVW